MTAAQDPYSRVYWRAVDDPKFVDVWDDDRALATWLRLLVYADMAWPASGSLYHGIHRPSLEKLVRVGLVDVQGSTRYRIHGLDKEREQRSTHARGAAVARHEQPASNPRASGEHPVSSAQGMPSQAEQSKDKQSTQVRALPDISPEDGLPHIGEETQKVGERLTGRGILSAGDKQLTELDRLIEDHGEAKVQAAMSAVADGKQMTWRQLIWGAMKRLEPIPVASRKDDVEEENRARWAKERERTRQMIAELQG